jgi:hypothetical protein
MQMVRAVEKTGPDGVLHLHIPLGRPATECEVVIIWQPKAPAAPGTPEERGWPPGFFEQTAGSWEGDLERPPQAEYEKRLDFD